MSQVPAFTATGTKSTKKVALDKSVFGLTVENHELLKQAYVAYQANGRENFARTKTRGEVRGGGKKPWKQKGTGRARFGSSRVPIWRGGGITFGPTGNENYSKKLNIKSKRLAIRQALSLATSANKMIVVDEFKNLNGKTKDFVTFLDKIGAQRRILIVVCNKPGQVLATRNLSNVKVVKAEYLNVFDVLNSDTIVVCNKALSAIGDWLGENVKTAKKEEVKK